MKKQWVCRVAQECSLGTLEVLRPTLIIIIIISLIIIIIISGSTAKDEPLYHLGQCYAIQDTDRGHHTRLSPIAHMGEIHGLVADAA